jgi:hypothetical protein
MSFISLRPVLNGATTPTVIALALPLWLAGVAIVAH